MKALTLTQPWATLVILGIKRFETRGWPIPASMRRPGVRIAIHAAKGWTADDREFAAELYQAGRLPVAPEDLPRGAVLGTVRLDGLYRTSTACRKPEVAGELDLGDYSPGRYAWEMGRPEPLPEPIPARGMLGLWEWERPA